MMQILGTLAKYFSLEMTFLWGAAFFLSFFSLVDFFWALGISAGACWMLISEGQIFPRCILAGALILIWSFRLSGYLGLRLWKHFPQEDARYENLKQEWKSRWILQSFAFFQLQGLSQIFLCYPFFVLAKDPEPFRVTEFFAMALVVLGLAGEALADKQLSQFKKQQRGICQKGLWRYSRHPNYFFEWLIWCGFGLWACQADVTGAQAALLCPLGMGILLGWITGVLPSEAQSLKSHGEAYRAYQKTTSCFFPWFQTMADKSFLENFLFCIPDGCIRFYMRILLQQRLNELQSFELQTFIASFENSPLAISIEDSKNQHYEIPAAFFEKTLGPRLKYSSCYFEKPTFSLEEAEEAMLALTCKRAELQDGQRILELGCGWGSLTLWMARNYPHASILAVSHSSSQKQYILEACKKRGISNIEVITCDMNTFETQKSFDRIISVEMFEHMRNIKLLFQRLRTWIKPDGKLFVHVFSHEKYAYYFETKEASDWLAKHFFTGGMMPSHTLYQNCTRDFQLQENWVVDGYHYAQTAKHWLQNMEKNKKEIMPILKSVYGENASLYWYRWRIFFMACFELWNWKKKPTWQVSHFLFTPKKDAS